MASKDCVHDSCMPGAVWHNILLGPLTKARAARATLIVIALSLTDETTQTAESIHSS